MLGILNAYTFSEMYRISEFPSGLIGEGHLQISLHACLFVIALLGLIYHRNIKTTLVQAPKIPVFVLFIFLLMLSPVSIIMSTILTNVLVLGLGVLTVKTGLHKDHLGIMNYGLLIITIFVICRFFSVDIPFVIRGILFIVMGILFFVANRMLINKRRENDE